MRVWRMYKRWRAGYWQPIEIDATGAAISDRLDAVEYELNSLSRDLARIGCRHSGKAGLETGQKV